MPSWRPTCPLALTSTITTSSRAHPAHVSALSGPGTKPGIRPVRSVSGEGHAVMSDLPVAFRRTGIGLLGRPVPAEEIGPSSRSAYRGRTPARTPTGFPRSACARHDRGGCPLCPGAAVFTRPVRCPRPPPAASQRPALHPGRTSRRPGLTLTRRHQRFAHAHPSGLPLTCDPRTERESLGLNPELRTPPLPATHVRAGTGPNTSPGYATNITNLQQRSHSPHTTSCRTTREVPLSSIRCGLDNQHQTLLSRHIRAFQASESLQDQPR
jgi:hypothetical protein